MTDKTIPETGSAVASRRRVHEKPRAAAPEAPAANDLRLLLSALSALKQGDASVRLPIEWTGLHGKLAGQAKVKGVAGTWKDLTDSVNSIAGNLTAQVRNIAEVTTAVALGDLSKKITVDVKGEVLELKNTINTMVDQLRSFASEVT